VLLVPQVDGGMEVDVYDSMAAGVQGAFCVVPFLTQKYQVGRSLSTLGCFA
jgi:hypothetical protein